MHQPDIRSPLTACLLYPHLLPCAAALGGKRTGLGSVGVYPANCSGCGATDQPVTQRPGLLAVGGVVFAYELLSPFLFIEGSAEDFSMR